MSEFRILSLKAFSVRIRLVSAPLGRPRRQVLGRWGGAAARDLPKGADQGPTAVKKRGDKQTVRDKEHRAGASGAPVKGCTLVIIMKYSGKFLQKRGICH